MNRSDNLISRLQSYKKNERFHYLDIECVCPYQLRIVMFLLDTKSTLLKLVGRIWLTICFFLKGLGYISVGNYMAIQATEISDPRNHGNDMLQQLVL